MRRRYLINSFVRQPRNQIWYTSTDRNVITPIATNVFGANIVSNTYSDGKGIITCDGDVTTIGRWAFHSCKNLTSITIPNSVTSIGVEVFFNCKNLTNVTIPDSVTTIGNSAFVGCDNLTSITIPDSVTKIGNTVFYKCTSLTSVYCKATTPPVLGYDVFDENGSGRKIYVPYQSLDAYKTATNWSGYASAIVGYDFENDTIV